MRTFLPVPWNGRRERGESTDRCRHNLFPPRSNRHCGEFPRGWRRFVASREPRYEDSTRTFTPPTRVVSPDPWTRRGIPQPFPTTPTRPSSGPRRPWTTTPRRRSPRVLSRPGTPRGTRGWAQPGTQSPTCPGTRGSACPPTQSLPWRAGTAAATSSACEGAERVRECADRLRRPPAAAADEARPGVVPGRDGLRVEV